MDFAEKLQAALGSLKMGPGSDEGWLRPLEVDMSLGYAVNILVRHALAAGYTKDEVAGVLAQAAADILDGSGASH